MQNRQLHLRINFNETHLLRMNFIYSLNDFQSREIRTSPFSNVDGESLVSGDDPIDLFGCHVHREIFVLVLNFVSAVEGTDDLQVD